MCRADIKFTHDLTDYQQHTGLQERRQADAIARGRLGIFEVTADFNTYCFIVATHP
jgi:hypothetical protein